MNKLCARILISLMLVLLFAASESLAVGDHEKYGYIDIKGNWVIQPTFVMATPFYHGFANVEVWDEQANKVIKKTIDHQGKFVDPPPVETARAVQQLEKPELYSFVATQEFPGDYREGYKNQNGDIVIPARFHSAEDFHEGLAAVLVGGKWSYIDKTGKTVIALPDDVSHASYFRNGYAAIAVGGERWTGQFFQPSHGSKWAFIDKNGNLVLGPTYEVNDSIVFNLHFNEGVSPVLCPVKDGLAYGFIDYSGKLVIPARFVHAYVFSEGVAPVSVGVLGFDPVEWKRSVDSRQDLLPKLFAQYKIVGMTRDEFHSLLGDSRDSAVEKKSNDSEGYSMSTSWCGHAQWGILFQFRNDKVVRYRLTSLDHPGKWRSDNKVPYLRF